MADIITVDIEAYDPALGGVRTLRYATQGYVTGAADTPAHTYYEGRIQQPANVKRTCFTDARTAGRTQIGYGDMVLVNNDGALDGLLNYSFSGRPITIKLGTVLPNSNGVPSWVTVLKGVMEQAEFSWGAVTVRVRDRQQDLAKPLQQVRYAGTNALPAGLEGLAADLKGKPKPLVFGSVYNVAPPQVNTDRRIYQVHAGSALQSVAVYDKGVLLTAGAAYASQADMEANAPAAGQYRVWNDATAGCFFRLGSAPAGTVTVDAVRGATAATRTVGQLYSQILQAAGVPVGDIVSADITALDAAAAHEVGVYADHQRDVTTLELLDQVCNSVGAWYGCDTLGRFRLGQIVAPSGTSVGTITATDVVKIDRVATRDAGAGIPAWKVKLDYQRVYTVQTDLGTNVSDARKTFVASEYRRAEASDAAVKTVNVTSPELAFATQLVTESAAAAEATRRLTLYKTRRDMLEVTIRVDSALASVLDIGKVVTLQLNRFGMGAGKQFLIIGLRTNLRGYLFDLTLWG